MNNDIITVYDINGMAKTYKMLLVIKKEYQYIVYTDINNDNIKENLYAIKINDLDDKETLPINDEEWQMIEKEYQKIINI